MTASRNPARPQARPPAHPPALSAALTPGQAPSLLPQGEALVDVLDRLLARGVMLDGQLVLSVAGVDLVQLNLRALLASVEAARPLAAHPLAERVA
ncbi:gas vesicle protein [Roseomonas sp. GC11]|uniref:gas vesicle protein n=1 Tax=Roseomonas sp. GC11 TaxID=2950546 RepID=UPI00272E5174|nr:gas vesicle protein [Roseomonas sp. GC11]